MTTGCKDADKCLFKIACDHSWDEIFVCSSDGTSLYVNPEACQRYYGVSREEFIGRKVRDLEKEGYFSVGVAPIVLEEKKTVTITQRTRTGRFLLVTGTPIFNENGDLELVVGNSRDITALEEMRKNFEEARLMAQKYQIELENLRRRSFVQAGIVYNSSSMQTLLAQAARFAETDATVLITGETGTGKNIIAKFIHRQSKRSSRHFFRVSCAAIPETLLESELFGYRPGAFTGATRSGKPGFFQLADGGTILLDEIGDLPLHMQSKILHILEDKEFIPVGGDKAIHVDVRVIAATNKPLERLVRSGAFREDLFYRLNVARIEVPPLRQRKEDIPELVEHFLQCLAEQYGTLKTLSADALSLLMEYDWPGNVRELEHLIERVYISAESAVITGVDLPDHLRTRRSSDQQNCRHSLKSKEGPCTQASQGVTDEDLIEAYDRLRSTYKVARLYGLSQSAVYRRIGGYVTKLKKQSTL